MDEKNQADTRNVEQVSHVSRGSDTHRREELRKPINWRYWYVLCGFTAFAALLLLQEHRAHMWGMFIYLILFLCPLMLLVIYREEKSMERSLTKTSDDDKENDE